VSDKNELNVGLKRGGRQSSKADPDRTNDGSCTDDRRSSMRDLADGTVLRGLMRLMVMVRLRGGKSNEGNQSNEGRESCEPFHAFFLIWPMPKLTMKKTTRMATIVEPVGRSNW
jgi:hypothetical protein